MINIVIDKIKQLVIKENFNPSWLSIFINPLYFTRKGLFDGIKCNAKYMKGIMLDFGCGLKPYKHLFDVTEYIGLDIVESGHDHRDEDIDVFYDGKIIPFKDNYFDSIFSSQVFEHVSNLSEILDEIYRVMKPGAKLLVTVPFVWDEHEIPYDYQRCTSFGIRYKLESKGFKVIKIEKTTNYIETIFQMWNVYVSQFILPSNKYLRAILTTLVISPVTIIAIILSKILPESYKLYHDNIAVAEKQENNFYVKAQE